MRLSLQTIFILANYGDIKARNICKIWNNFRSTNQFYITVKDGKIDLELKPWRF